MQTELGSLRLDQLVNADSVSATVLAEATKGAWLEFAFQFETAPPHKLLSIRIEQAEPPSAAESQSPMTEREFLDSLGARLDNMSKNDEFSGAVLIAKNGSPVFQKAYGLASTEFGVPNRTDTKFNLGSINKIFTRVAIGQLIEQGKVRFEDTLGKFLPDYPLSDARRQVEISHLISMTSGIGDFFGETFDDTPKDRFRSNSDFLPMFDSLPLQFAPGSQRQYSNGGYVLLGAIIEKVSGESYYDYVREHIFNPASMSNTDSYEADVPVANLAEGYTNSSADHSMPRRKNIYTRPARGSAAGGGYSTAEDLLKFAIALENNRLLTPAYTEWLLTDAPPDPQKTRSAGQQNTGGPQGIGVAGGAPGINASLEADFSSGYTVVVLGNYDPPNTERVAKQARKWLKRVTKSK
jgi:CubicO group peptidase (beta-lactamase class C family)